jgi:hypothetical protein
VCGGGGVVGLSFQLATNLRHIEVSKKMENARAASAIFLGVITTIFGTWELNVLVVSSLYGETSRETYSFTALESLIRFLFYVVVGVSVALAAGKKRTIVLAITGTTSLIALVMNSYNWMEPSLSTYEKVVTYLLVYSPTFSIVPAFILVGFVFFKWKNPP